MSSEMVGRSYWSSHSVEPMAIRVVSVKRAYAQVEFGTTTEIRVRKSDLHQTWADAREAIVNRWRCRLLRHEADANQAREMKRMAERLEKPAYGHWADMDKRAGRENAA